MPIVRMHRIGSCGLGFSLQGFVFVDNSGLWQFKYFDNNKTKWVTAPLEDFYPAASA